MPILEPLPQPQPIKDSEILLGLGFRVQDLRFRVQGLGALGTQGRFEGDLWGCYCLSGAIWG